MSLSDRLRKQMRWRGIQSQSQLARISGVPQASIHRILVREHHAPRLDTLRRLAHALDTTVAWLDEGLVANLTPEDLPPEPDAAEQALADGYQRELLALTMPLDAAARRQVVAVVRLLVKGLQPASGHAPSR
ncbi:helix-turn-helix domain-containing protein [Pseudomonadota bacterium AL_CKDN230030165-1A_HGKHYDSX7]